MQNKFLDKTKVVSYGVMLVLVILITGLVYSYTTFDKVSIDKNSILEGKFFTILRTFNDEKIDFSNISGLVSSTFDELKDTSSVVSNIKTDGRVNPFAP